MRSLPARWCVSGVTSKSKCGFAQSLPLRGEEWPEGLCIIPGTLRNGPHLTLSKASFGLFLRPLLLIVSGPGGACMKAHVCLNLLWNSSDGLEVSRILRLPESCTGPLHLFPNTSFHMSLTSTQPRRLRMATGGKDTVGHEQPLRATQQGRGRGSIEQRIWGTCRAAPLCAPCWFLSVYISR